MILNGDKTAEQCLAGLLQDEDEMVQFVAFAYLKTVDMEQAGLLEDETVTVLGEYEKNTENDAIVKQFYQTLQN